MQNTETSPNTKDDRSFGLHMQSPNDFAQSAQPGSQETPMLLTARTIWLVRLFFGLACGPMVSTRATSTERLKESYMLVSRPAPCISATRSVTKGREKKKNRTGLIEVMTVCGWLGATPDGHTWA